MSELRTLSAAAARRALGAAIGLALAWQLLAAAAASMGPGQPDPLTFALQIGLTSADVQITIQP